MLALDFETSGYSNRGPCVPVEIGLVRLHPDGRMEILASSLISGATWIAKAAWRTHGIGLAQTRGKPALETFRKILETAAKEPICVHAKGTERKIMEEHFGLQATWIDTLTLSRRALPKCPNHQLATVTRYLGLEVALRNAFPQGRWHRADYDAAASALIAKKLQTELELELPCL